MELIKEITTQIFDTEKIKAGYVVYITDNKFDTDDEFKTSYGGAWLVQYVCDSILKLIDHKGNIVSFSARDFFTKYPLSDVPNYEIKLLKCE